MPALIFAYTSDARVHVLRAFWLNYPPRGTDHASGHGAVQGRSGGAPPGSPGRSPGAGGAA
eukprot:12577565-Alexandrium_andersonii.AAC.1